jgi:hypothetical protein
MTDFLAELKRRKIYRVAVAYAVAGWLLVQAAAIFLPTFDAPPWVMKTLIALVALGFPAALIFTWALEAKLEQGLRPTKSLFAVVTVALLVLASALWVFNVQSKRRTTTTNFSPGKNAPAAAVSGVWEGVIRFGKNGDTPFTLKVSPDGSSVVQSSTATGDVLHNATVGDNALAWRSGRMQNLAWTLTPNTDAQTAVLTLKYPNGLMATATFRRVTTRVSAANAKVTAEAQSSP